MTLAPGKALRVVFGETLAELATEDPRIVVLDADVGSSSGGEIFERAHPERFVQCGIAEQNMLGVAAGLATVGFIPVVSAFSCFVVGRAFDSIRVLVAQTGLDVKIIGGYTGLLTGMTGKTHQMFDDLALMRSLAGVVIVAPADEVEARQALRAICARPGPAYVQITRDPSPTLFPADHLFELGKAVTLRHGDDVTLMSTGVESARVYEAAGILAGRGIESTVLHISTVKPIDEAAIVRAAAQTGFVVVIEEQSVLGGLGGAVAEVVADRHPVTVKRLGVMDTYGESGPNDALLEKYRLSPAAIAEDVERLLNDAGRRPMAGSKAPQLVGAPTR